MCIRPIIIVEGPGDAAALPILVRRIAEAKSLHEMQTAPRPKTNVDVGKLLRAGEIERFVAYTWTEAAGDSVLIALDCEDIDQRVAYDEFQRRVRSTPFRKPTAIVLFRREFEVMFLHSMDEIKSSYPEFRWNQLEVPASPEDIRGVKECISRMMPKDKAYKETRDQPKFSSAVSIEKLRSNASFVTLERAIIWLSEQATNSSEVFTG